MRLVLSEAADADLDGITRYTRREWGLEQARDYTDGILDLLDRLVDGDLVSAVDVDWAPFRRLKFKSHAIFFRVDAEQITVIRILHVSMDAPRHLR